MSEEKQLSTGQLQDLLERFEKAYWNLGEAMDARESSDVDPYLVMGDWQRECLRQYQAVVREISSTFPALAREVLEARRASEETYVVED